MKIIVRNRPQAETVDPPEVSHLIVSISTPGDEPAKPKTNEHTILMLKFQFHDADREVLPGTAAWSYFGGDVQLFTAEMAEQIVDVLSEENVLIVHCDAGQSRSAGVAAAVSKWFNGTDDDYFRPPYTPNRLVYRMMLEALVERYG